MTAPDPIGELVRCVQATRYDDLPGTVVDVVKKAVVDTVGSGVAGSSAPMGTLVADSARDHGGRAESTLWVHGDRLPAPEAAFANAIMARCRELDDVHEGTERVGRGHGGHVNVMIVPAALATAETIPGPVSGRDLITAMAVGGDVIPRIRMAAGDAGRLGFEAPTIAPFGVAATVGKLLGFGAGVMANAMGAAYAHCSGTVISTTDGTWDVWLNAGLGTRGGMVAADLARRGHQGARAPLLGDFGLYPLYFRGEYHADALLSDLGKEFESANVSIKPYSACKCTHHAIYTALELVRAHGIRPERIARIAVRTCTYNMRLVGRNEAGELKHTPRNLNEAQFSMPFTVATAILRGTVFPDVLHEGMLNDPEILALARKVEMEVTAEKDELNKKEGYPPDDVDVHTVDGRVYRGCAPFVKGHPRNPMSFEEVAEKFRRCATLTAKPFARGALDEFVARVRRLEQLDDVRSLVRDLHKEDRHA